MRWVIDIDTTSVAPENIERAKALYQELHERMVDVRRKVKELTASSGPAKGEG